MRVIVGADHRGFDLKVHLSKWLVEQGYEVVDVGAESYDQNDDYVDFAKLLVEQLKVADRGVLICGSGQGMVMAANRKSHVRALLGYNQESVIKARQDEDANVLCLPADDMDEKLAIELLGIFLETEFSGEARHSRRINKLAEI